MTFPTAFQEHRLYPSTWFWASLACQSVYDDGAPYRNAIFQWPRACNWEYVAHPPNFVSPDWILADYFDAAAVVIRGTNFWSRELFYEAAWILNTYEHPLHRGTTTGYFGLAAYQIWNVLRPKLETTSGWQRVIFTGHSWGGAVAMILAQMYQRHFQRPVLACITFGAPKPGNGEFATGCEFPVFRLENIFDPIPYLPNAKLLKLPLWAGLPVSLLYNPFAHPGTAWIIDEDGGIYSCLSVGVTPRCQRS